MAATATASTTCMMPSTPTVNDANEKEGDDPAEARSPSLSFQGLAMQPPLPDTQSECAYSASIPDSPLPAMLPISFERDDKPFRPKSLPRHSPLIRPNINNNAKHDALTTELSTYSNHEPYDQLSVSLSVPESGTSSVKTTVTDQASSLFYGFLMGVFPPLILLRTMFALCFPMLDSPEILNHRYYVYGRSLGMLTLVIVIIIVVVVVIKLR